MPLYQRLLLLLMLSGFPAAATHIVGGEFEMLYLSPNRYRINMILYFDAINGSPAAVDRTVKVYIYRKRDRTLAKSFDLPQISRTTIAYTQPACSYDKIKTDKLIYTSDVTLEAGSYSDPEGYYLVWQRCCRNYNITNIYSDEITDEANNPVPNAIYAGQTFYLEFAALIQNGKPFKNSSPRLFPPLTDYACPGKPFYAIFSGTDDDGDSLSYTLVTPLNTTEGKAFPDANPGPYPEVKWRTNAGYSLKRIMLGNPEMNISPDGILRVTPTVKGLFAFAVRVDEFRNKVKIGETRRDFQLFVVEKCANSVPPVIKGRKLTDADFSDAKTLDVAFDAQTKDEERCVEIRVTDEDSKIPEQYTENITVDVKALNFPQSKLTGLPDFTKSAVLKNGSSLIFKFCLPKCPFVKNGAARIAITAKDDACAMPLTDTLKINVTIPDLPNNLPEFKEPPPNKLFEVHEGETLIIPVEAEDKDGDIINLTASDDGYAFTDFGMSFNLTPDQPPGQAKGTFQLIADCKNYNFADKNNFRVLLHADDEDECRNPGVKIPVNIKVRLTDRKLPIIDSDLTDDKEEREVEVSRKIGESLSFTVTGRDPDNNELLGLNGNGVGFGLTTYRMTFPPVAETLSPVSSGFNWTPTCDDLKTRAEYRLRFVVNDQTNKCSAKNGDTLLVNVKLFRPDNHKPTLQFDNTQQLPFNAGAYELKYGTQVDFTVRGKDEDQNPQDQLALVLTNVIGDPTPAGYEFKPAAGQGDISSPFTWPTDCSVFKEDKYSNSFGFIFKVSDDRCLNPIEITDTLKIRVIDPSDKNAVFTPPNVITPNGDGCNDYFAVEDNPQASCGTRPWKINFPSDNCVHTFEYVKILNRFGKEVFSSRSRDFRWYANEAASGIYYFYIKFTDSVFKGWVDVIR